MPRATHARFALPLKVGAALAFQFLIALPPACGDPGDTEATYSRKKILPLVSSPGKQRGLFSSFSNGKDAAWNGNFWGASLGFDQFTGIGWGTAQAGVLITPEHVLSAGHFGVGRKGVHFYGRKGEYLGSRSAARNAQKKIARVTVQPDITVTRLASPAPAGARIYPLPDPKTHERRVAWGKLPKEERPLLIATDWRNAIPKKTTDPKERQRWRPTRSAHPVTLGPTSSPSKVLRWTYGPNGDAVIDPSYHEVINKGDSSHPLFWVTRSGLVLASTFTSPTGGPDYGHPEVQATIQKAINTLGGTKQYTLKTAPVP